MELGFKIAVTICWIIIVTCILGIIRMNQAHKERMRILDIVGEKALEDVFNRLPYQWRFNAYEEISFLEMILKFWKPVKSFYKDHKCIK